MDAESQFLADLQEQLGLCQIDNNMMHGEILELQELCARAADALEHNAKGMRSGASGISLPTDWSFAGQIDLITDLREASK
jgi:hypothetical protein